MAHVPHLSALSVCAPAHAQAAQALGVKDLRAKLIGYVRPVTVSVRDHGPEIMMELEVWSQSGTIAEIMIGPRHALA